jgi:signal transduction histidine kinase
MAMAIELAYVQEGQSGTAVIQGAVAHLGQEIPNGKQGVTLRGQGVADHHGKIFYAYQSYRYVNLTARPTEVLRGENFSFRLDPFMPQCQVFEGDQLKLGTALVKVTRLTPPARPPLPKIRPMGSRIHVTQLDCTRCSLQQRYAVVRVVGELTHRLRDYAVHHEILRASADWLVDLFCRGPVINGGLQLGRPAAIAVRPIPGAEAAWDGFDESIERGITHPDARVRSTMGNVLPIARLHAGRAFRFEANHPKVLGAAVGILEETSYAEESPAAGHFFVVEYGGKPRGRRDDLCVLHHAAVNVSEALATVDAARLRRERELERRGGLAVRGIFHDMKGQCKAACASLAAVESSRGGRGARLSATLEGVRHSLERIADQVTLGLDAFSHDQSLQYVWVDLIDSSEKTLGSVFGDSTSLRQTRDWSVCVSRREASRLRTVPGDVTAVGRILYNLVTNARDALGKRGPDPLVKRVHILLGMVNRNGLRYARIRVADDGPGMEPAALSVIFAGRFSTTSGGHGFGTQVVTDLVRRHRGFIEVASSPGKGTVTGVLLPAPAPQQARNIAAPDKQWLGPYAKQAMESVLVTREDLQALARRDPDIRRWYAAQGRQP